MSLLSNTVKTFFESIGIDMGLVIWGNSLFDYLLASVLFVFLTILFKVIQFVILRRLAKLAEKTETDIDDTIIRIVESLRPQFYAFLAFYLSLFSLELNVTLGKVLTALLLIFLVYQVVKAVGVLIDYIGEKRTQKEKEEDGEVDLGSKAAISLVRTISKILLWTVGLLLILSNLGIEITSLIAGLGVGGIAIAFALQSILGDLFSSFTIYFDKPFKVGDFIVVGDLTGTVESIGIKTTRLRALQGEEIIIPNADITASRIHNYKRMEKRRIVFTFGVLYETPVEKLKKITQIVENVFESVKGADLDRVHFKNLGDFSLDFESVYYVFSSNYAEYMDIQQNVNFALIEIFEKEGIEFAYPTQTVYIAK